MPQATTIEDKWSDPVGHAGFRAAFAQRLDAVPGAGLGLVGFRAHHRLAIGGHEPNEGLSILCGGELEAIALAGFALAQIDSDGAGRVLLDRVDAVLGAGP